MQILKKNKIKYKPLLKGYSQLHGKIEAFNKIVKNEILAVENISNVYADKKISCCFYN